MLITNVFLGKPPANIESWILNHYGPPSSKWDEIIAKLESFDEVASPTAQGLPEVGAACTAQYMICDGYMDGGTFVPCLTKQSVMDNIDKIDGVETNWIVLGYNANPPGYVKYKNGKNYVYVCSVDDTVENGFLRPIAAGCKCYSRAWSDELLKNVFTETGKTVGAVGSGTFTYGQTRSDWGTTATTAGGYSVPRSITVDGVEYAFCGYTISLQTQYLLGSSKDGENVTEKTCAFAYGTSSLTYWSRWNQSHMQVFLNSRVGHNEITWPRFTPTANMLGLTNSIGLKFAKEKDMLRCSGPAVNRRWVHSLYRDGAHLDSNYCEYTLDEFSLLGTANVNALDNAKVYGDQYDDFAKFTSVYPEETTVGSSTVKSEYLKKYAMNDLTGVPSTSAATWRLSTAVATIASSTAFVNNTGYVSSNIVTTNAYGVAPLCLLY